MHAGLELALHLIDLGVIEVRPQGEIWKLARRTADPTRVIPIEPRRLDYMQTNGYWGIHFCWNMRQYQVQAHQLIWTILKGPIPAGYEVNHKDGDTWHNHPDNFELMTRSENQEHAYRTGLRTVTPAQRAALGLRWSRGSARAA